MTGQKEHVAIVRKVCLSILAAAILTFAATMEVGGHDGAALCGGRRYQRGAVPNGASPYIELSADGVTGPFLLDYGATRSSLSASAFAATKGTVKKASISLPGFESGDFDLRRYDLLLQPEKRQLGVIGADFLSRLVVQLTRDAVFLGVKPCDSGALRARGLVPIAQKGFFSSDPSRIDAGLPNVPVAFLRLGELHAWAQIDTGYDDTVYPHSVDINKALYERLVETGVKLERLADISVWTCDGPESRQVYSVKGSALTIEDERARPIVQPENFHLILKLANACGSIGAMTAPAAQLGASFLNVFGTAIFDPKSEIVWMGGAGKGQSTWSR